MKSAERSMARKQLDKRLNDFRHSNAFARPPKGWIKAIRDALGMTTAQLGKRIGISQPRVIELEKSELSGVITLNTLERAAQAMDCRLVYLFVPRKSLQKMVEERALTVAKRRLKRVSHSMALEDQRPDKEDEQAQLDDMVRKLVEKAGSELWGDK